MFRRSKTAVVEAIPVGDRYTIDRELGRGGMAVVYLARDRNVEHPGTIIGSQDPAHGGVHDLRR